MILDETTDDFRLPYPKKVGNNLQLRNGQPELQSK